MATLSTIKNWFKTGLKPTQAQFWATWDSFWHKDQSIPQANITNLQQDLLLKQDKEGLHAVATSGNYYDLENLPGGIVEVNAYEDIPLIGGNYMFSPSASIDLLTSVARLDDTPIYLTELLPELFVGANRATVIRSFVSTEEKKGYIFKNFIDTFYVEGVKYGYSEVRYTDDVLDFEYFMLKIEDPVLNSLFNFNSFQVYYSDTSKHYWLNLKGNDVDVNKSIIKTDIQLLDASNISFIKSDVFVNNHTLGSCEIGLDYNNFIVIKDNSGQLIKNPAIESVRIVIEANTQTRNLVRIINHKTNKELNVAVLENTSTVHSDAMALTFEESYGSAFPNVIYKNPNPVILNFYNNYIEEVMFENDIDLVFSAGSGVGMIKRGFLNNSYGVVPIHNNNLIRIDLTDAVDKFPPNYITVTSRAETDNDGTDPLGTSYGFGTEFNEPTLSADLTGQGLTDWPGSAEHQQSPAAAIVAGKLKKIKDETGAPWDIVREAARQTASNANSYNIYRGFGVIDVNAAIAAIPAMLNARSLELAEYFEATSKFPKELKYEDKGDNTPVVKRDLEQIKTGFNSDSFKVNRKNQNHGFEVLNGADNCNTNSRAKNGNVGFETTVWNTYSGFSLWNAQDIKEGISMIVTPTMSSFSLKKASTGTEKFKVSHENSLGVTYIQMTGSDYRLRFGTNALYRPDKKLVLIGNSVFEGDVGIEGNANIHNLNLSKLAVFADDAAASSLPAGDVYRTATGELRIKL